MNELEQELFEKRLTSITRKFQYPRTPDIAGSVMRRLRSFLSPTGRGGRGEERPRFASRRLAWSLTILLILCSSLMLIPPARAAILDFIQIGVVRIFGPPSTPPRPTAEIPSTIIPRTATPGPTSQPLIPMLERLAGEMTLDEARESVDYPILLPSYPPELGAPDRIFVQEADGKMAILVWLDPHQPEQVLMSLHFIPPGSWAIDKMEPTTIQETSVDGERAIWTIGPYPLRLRTSDIEFTRLVDGHVLIWERENMTYRLETDLPLEESIRIAESLEPIR